MGDLLGSLIWGAKSGQYCVIGGGSLHHISSLNIAQPNNHSHSQPPLFHLSTKKYSTSNNQNKQTGQLQPITITETHPNYQPVSCAPTQNDPGFQPETRTTSPDPPETHAHQRGFDRSGTPSPALSPVVPFRSRCPNPAVPSRSRRRPKREEEE
jgi:hypothetical protein